MSFIIISLDMMGEYSRFQGSKCDISNNNMNDNKLNNNSNTKNNIQLKKKDEQKVKIIQNFSSYHKIKYKSHISEKINYDETQSKQFCFPREEFNNCNKNNNNNNNNLFKNNQKYNYNTSQQGGEKLTNNNNNNPNYNNNNNKINHIKFRKLEKLPGDSDNGDVDLND